MIRTTCIHARTRDLRCANVPGWVQIVKLTLLALLLLAGRY
jgi:hypothetical protein